MNVATAAQPLRHRYGRNCPCRYCRAIRVHQTRRWRQRRAEGVVFWMDAAPVRAHVQRLMAIYGMPADSIATQAGVSHGTIRNLLYGNGAPPSRRLVAANGQRLLAAHFDLDSLRDATLINPIGTRRRIQGLVIAGYCVAELARRLGRDRNFYQTLLAETVRADLARAVRDLADALEAIPPPADTRAQRVARSKAASMAGQHPDWVPLAAWDDIDDPAAVPVVVDHSDTLPDPAQVDRILTGVDSIKDLRAVDIYGAITRLCAAGKGATAISERLKCNGGMAKQLIHRTAIYELLAYLDARDALHLRLLRCLDTGVVHVAATAVLDICTDAALTLCPYRGEPAAVQLVERFAGKTLCPRCRPALGPFWPRVRAHML